SCSHHTAFYKSQDLLSELCGVVSFSAKDSYKDFAACLTILFQKKVPDILIVVEKLGGKLCGLETRQKILFQRRLVALHRFCGKVEIFGNGLTCQSTAKNGIGNSFGREWVCQTCSIPC